MFVFPILQCRLYRLYRAVRVEMHPVDAHLTVVACRPSALQTVRTLETVVDDVPFVCAGFADDSMMSCAVNLSVRVFAEDNGILDRPVIAVGESPMA